MFENVLGHDRLIQRFKNEIIEHYLPSSLLFVGDEGVGKLTTAFELSRVLMCAHKGEWGCLCPSCNEHWLLASNSTLFLGKRNVIPELQAHLQFALRSAGSDVSQYARILILRSIHKLLSPFNSALAAANDAALKKAAADLEKLKELLAPIYNQPLLNPITITEDWKDKVLSIATKIQGVLPSAISIEEIRLVNQWAWTSGHNVRTVIIDGVDTLNASAANSLLKTLEEPPKNLYFILLAKRRGAVLPTILSRVRVYDFLPRTVEKEQEVLQRIFREDDFLHFSSVKEYINQFSGIHLNEFDQAAKNFLMQVCGISKENHYDMEPLFALVNDTNRFSLFLERLIWMLQEAGKEESIFSQPFSFDLLDKWNELIRNSYMMHSAYNQNIKSLLESLFLGMKNTILK